MIQWKLPRDGANMKNAGGGEVFMNPQRDIAHAFNSYVLRTFEMVTNPDSALMKWYYTNGGTDDDLVLVARFFRKFLEITAGKPDIALLAEASKEAGYSELPLLARLVVGHAMMNVVTSAFFQGFREAHSKACAPDLELEVTLTKGKIHRFLKKVLRSLLYALD
jgi:hypothetical protein